MLINKPKKKRKHPVDPRHIEFVRQLGKGKDRKAALEAAGIHSKNPREKGRQIIKDLEERMPATMAKFGLTPDSLVRDLLNPLCYATETKFFPYRVEEIVTPAKVIPAEVITHDAEGKKLKEPFLQPAVVIPAVTRTVQKIETRNVISWKPRRDGLDIALQLGGYYPTRSEQEANQLKVGVKVVLVGVPRPGQPMARAIEVTSGNGDKSGGNGNASKV